MTGLEGSDSEFRVAAIVLGASGMALIAALRAICDALRQREEETGRQFTSQERDAILAAASAIPGLEERLATAEVNLAALTEKFDEIEARRYRTRATDRGR